VQLYRTKLANAPTSLMANRYLSVLHIVNVGLDYVAEGGINTSKVVPGSP